MSKRTIYELRGHNYPLTDKQMLERLHEITTIPIRTLKKYQAVKRLRTSGLILSEPVADVLKKIAEAPIKISIEVEEQ